MGVDISWDSFRAYTRAAGGFVRVSVLELTLQTKVDYRRYFVFCTRVRQLCDSTSSPLLLFEAVDSLSPEKEIHRVRLFLPVSTNKLRRGATQSL